MRPASLVLLALLTVAPTLHAQITPPIHGIAAVDLPSADLQRSLAFYARLGFQPAFQFGADPAHPSQIFVRIADRQFLALTLTTTHPIPTVTFDVDAAEGLHDFYTQQRKLTATPVQHVAGNLAFTLTGPPEPGLAAQPIRYTQLLPGSPTGTTGKPPAADHIADEILALGLPFSDRDTARSFYLQKLSFEITAGRPWFVEVPGPSTEQILIETPTDRPRLYLHIATLDQTATLLRQRNVPFRQLPGALELTDPDGNLLELESAHIPVAIGSADR